MESVSAKNFAKVKNSYEPALLACRELNETAGLLRELERASNNLKLTHSPSLAAWNLNETVEQLEARRGTAFFRRHAHATARCVGRKCECTRTAPLLLRGLRARYSAAIVDEAQDTDRVQWDILQRIFVGSGRDSAASLRRGRSQAGDLRFPWGGCASVLCSPVTRCATVRANTR